MTYKEISANDFISLSFEIKNNEKFRIIRHCNNSTKSAEDWFTNLLLGQYHLSYECYNWSELWFKSNKLHRRDGPALIITTGSEFWFINGELHRDDGPAVIFGGGSKYWWKNGKLHRIDGPAGITEYGTKYWYRNDKLHRIDGPAIIPSKYCAFISGLKECVWSLDGKEYSKEKWFEQLTPEQKAIALANPENF